MKDKEKTFVSAVVYIYNKQNYIEKFLNTMIHVMEEYFEHSEIICVNDASDDDSVKIIKEVGKKAITTSIALINMSYFHGIELAMNGGVDLSIGDFVFEFDSINLDFDPSVIMEVYYRSLEGYDVVSASPNQKEKITSRLFYHIFDKFSDISYGMSTESFRILSRRVINRASSMNKTIPYRKVIYANCGLKMDKINYPVVQNSRKHLDKKERCYKSQLAVDSLILFTKLGYCFSIAMTIVMMVISIFMTVYSITIYATSHPVAGWTTTILFLSAAFFGLFGVLTVIIKYLQILVELVFKRKHYNFESIEKLSK